MVVGALLFASIVQVMYWWYALSADPPDEAMLLHDDAVPVSLVIAARNEEDKIGDLLDRLSRQDYPNFEVVVVDDCSTDKTADLVRQWRGPTSVQLVQNTVEHPGKKKALALGVGAAHHQWILCTDADCYPASNSWITEMMRRRSEHVAVIGYGPLVSQGTIASWLAAGEAVWTAIHYLPAAAAGRPYMAVGRNFLFSKAAFEEVGGYTAHEGIASGDDDLLVRDLAEIGSIGLAVSASAAVLSKAAASWREWVRQKARHLTTASHYGASAQRDLLLYAMSHIAVVALAGVAMMMGWVTATLIVLTAKWSLQLVLARRWLSALRQWRYGWCLPIVEVGLAMFYVFMSPYLWWRKQTW